MGLTYVTTLADELGTVSSAIQRSILTVERNFVFSVPETTVRPAELIDLTSFG
jgi:hypothetical protein